MKSWSLLRPTHLLCLRETQLIITNNVLNARYQQNIVIPLRVQAPGGSRAAESRLGLLTHNGVCVISKASLTSAERLRGPLTLSLLNGLSMTPTTCTLNRGFLWHRPGLGPCGGEQGGRRKGASSPGVPLGRPWCSCFAPSPLCVCVCVFDEVCSIEQPVGDVIS